MGCGEARFGRKGQKTPKIENCGLKVCSLGPRGDLRMRPQGNPHGPRGRQQCAMIENELYHTPGSNGRGACGAISCFASWGVV